MVEYDEDVEIITPLHFITLQELKQYGEITYAQIGIQHVNISYVEKPKYSKIKVSDKTIHSDEYQYAGNLPFSFACEIQDSETLDIIKDILQDYDITAALFTTYTGDYEDIHVGYGYPSFRKRDYWYRIKWNK